MSPLRRAAAISGILVLATAPVFAAGNLPASDVTFANRAAMGGLAEVQAAQLARQKAASADVKQFASQMDKDHTTANIELTALAKSKQMTLPTSPDSAHQAMAQEVSKMSGAQFDRQYMQGQVTDHETTVALFQQEASSGQDPQLKAFAQKYLPILQHHLQMAQSIKTSS